MKITIESTEKIVTINGVPARVWQGETAGGIPVSCAITRVAVRNGHPTEQFEKELQEYVPPNRDSIEAFDLRLVL